MTTAGFSGQGHTDSRVATPKAAKGGGNALLPY